LFQQQANQPTVPGNNGGVYFKETPIPGLSILAYPTIANCSHDMAESWRCKIQIQYQCPICGAKGAALQVIGVLPPNYNKQDLLQWMEDKGSKPPTFKNFRRGIVPGWNNLVDYPVFVDGACGLHTFELGVGPLTFDSKPCCSNR